jgi:hypothetical protein
MALRYNRSPPGCRALPGRPCYYRDDPLHNKQPRNKGSRQGTHCAMKDVTRCAGRKTDGTRCQNCGRFGLTRRDTYIYNTCFFHTPLPNAPPSVAVLQGRGYRWGADRRADYQYNPLFERRRPDFHPHQDAQPAVVLIPGGGVHLRAVPATNTSLDRMNTLVPRDLLVRNSNTLAASEMRHGDHFETAVYSYANAPAFFSWLG